MGFGFYIHGDGVLGNYQKNYIFEIEINKQIKDLHKKSIYSLELNMLFKKYHVFVHLYSYELKQFNKFFWVGIYAGLSNVIHSAVHCNSYIFPWKFANKL